MSTSPHIQKKEPAETKPAQSADGKKIHDLDNPPRVYNLHGLIEMDQPSIVDPDLDENEERFYAVAAIECVESTDGNTALDFEDAFTVLYLTSDCEYGYELYLRGSMEDRADVPRVKDMPLDDRHVRQTAEFIQERYKHVIPRHAEVDAAILRRAAHRAQQLTDAVRDLRMDRARSRMGGDE